MKFLLLAALFSTLGFGQSNDCDTLDKCQEAIKTDWRASLPHFRLGGIYFRQGNYTQAAN